MLFSHARQGLVVCLAMSQPGVNASLVMSRPRAAEEAPLSPPLTPSPPGRRTEKQLG